MVSKNGKKSPVETWLEPDNLMLLECWARDGYTLEDIALRIGVHPSTISNWKKYYPEIEQALSNGREIIDYKVENALLKSALGYRTKEVKITTTMRNGRVVETIKESTEKEQAPNVSAIQCWLYNRCNPKWRNMNSRSNLFDNISEDDSVQVIVTRASKGKNQTSEGEESTTDSEWQDEVNSSVELRKATPKEKADMMRQKGEQRKAWEKRGRPPKTKVKQEPQDDLDYWPEDWVDEE